jgi:hypothetical protein
MCGSQSGSWGVIDVIWLCGQMIELSFLLKIKKTTENG